MCQQRRKDPGPVQITTSYYYYFLAKSPPKTSFRFIIGFITVSILLLGITLIPPVVIFETEFTGINLNDSDVNTGSVKIGNHIGVTQILASFAAFSSTTTNFVTVSSLMHLVGYLVRTRILE